MESVSCWFPAPGYRWPAWSSSPGSSSSSCSPTAPTSPIRRYPTVPSTRAGSTVYSGDDVRDGQKVFLEQRPHGVRLDLRPRRLPRARTSPPTTCTAPRHRSAISSAARGPTPRGRRRSGSSRRTATTPPRRPCRSSAQQARAFEPAASALRGLLRQPDHQIRPAPEAGRRSAADPSADRLLRLVELGGRRPVARATTTPTPTTGRPRSRSGTRRAPTSSSGR